MRMAIAAFALLAGFTLVGVSVWATLHIGIVDAIAQLAAAPASGTHPWFVATLLDAYFGFLWFWLWIAYRERGVFARLVWLVAILALGNIAMAGYVLWQLARLPRGAGVEALLLRPA